MPGTSKHLNADSLERIIPDVLETAAVTGQETKRLHFERYEFAAQHVRPGRLLDMACGAGYGTRILVNCAPHPITAIGVDISPEAIEYAQTRYAAGNIEYRVGDALEFSDQEGFDTIVSLETIEHVADHRKLVARLVGLLRPGGVLIASVPTTPSVDANPHHQHDFTERSFRRMFEGADLVETAALRQVQHFRLMPLLTRNEQRARDLRPNLLAYYVTHPGSLAKRIAATLRYGLQNRYMTIAWSHAGPGHLM
jgi:2-polyprenyl-3-methyl-5-hydroxy-6-metoxy-1,4-benzoquinol methylase